MSESSTNCFLVLHPVHRWHLPEVWEQNPEFSASYKLRPKDGTERERSREEKVKIKFLSPSKFLDAAQQQCVIKVVRHTGHRKVNVTSTRQALYQPTRKINT